MEKFYLKNGKEVKFGSLVVSVSGSIDSNKGVSFNYVVLSEDNLQELVKAGIIIIKQEEDTSTKVPMDLEFYIQKIADKLGWKIDKVYNYLNSIDTIYPMAALSIVLREIALELDKQYKDHISNSSEIYVISTLDGKISKICKSHIKNYNNFAAFRSIDDAKIACNITREILKDLFRNERK